MQVDGHHLETPPSRYGCRVDGIDLTQEFVTTATAIAPVEMIARKAA